MNLAYSANRHRAQEREYTAGERAGLAAWLLRDGWRPTTAEAAAKLDLTRQGAHDLLTGLSRVLPIVRGTDGRWRRCD